MNSSVKLFSILFPYIGLDFLKFLVCEAITAGTDKIEWLLKVNQKAYSSGQCI